MIGTCGHEVGEAGDLLILGDFDEMGNRCLASVVYCKECTNRAHEDGMVMETPDQEDRWLNGYKVRYSTNWMGPVSLSWYRERGLLKTVEEILEKDSIFTNRKKGDKLVYEEIIEQWAGGRIDVRGTGNPYGEELGLPIMHGEDFNRFSDWLDTFETDFIWSLDQIVELYERANPKIRWAHETFKGIE